MGLLFAAAATDWLDGKIARAWHQESRLGQVLDPAADRLYIGAMLIALAIRAIIPWWLVGVLVARELVLGVALLCAARARAGSRSRSASSARRPRCACCTRSRCCCWARTAARPAEVARVAGWAFGLWGTALYWWAAGLYLAQTRQLTSRPGRYGAQAVSGRS